MQSPRFFWNERKHNGSEEKAKNDCLKFLEAMLPTVYKDTPSSDKLWIGCDDGLYGLYP